MNHLAKKKKNRTPEPELISVVCTGEKCLEKTYLSRNDEPVAALMLSANRRQRCVYIARQEIKEYAGVAASFVMARPQPGGELSRSEMLM